MKQDKLSIVWLVIAFSVIALALAIQGGAFGLSDLEAWKISAE